MLHKLKKYIADNALFSKEDNLLLAVSGGIDSMVMAHLFRQAGYNIAIAHCNFSLRGKESDEDEQLVATFAEKHKLRFFSIRFNTPDYAAEKAISIQMAARELRYGWFERLCSEHGFKYLATAHNRDDNVETFLLNLTRGTGIKGLCGIKPKSGHTVRPLLFASREDIEQYAAAHSVAFREDASNASDDYARNRIRHNVVPQLRIINPSFDATMVDNMLRIEQAQELVQQSLHKLTTTACTKDGELYKVEINELLQAPSRSLLLFELLQPFGFGSTTISDIEQSLYAQSGKRFYSPSHVLVRDREYLLIQALPAQEQVEVEIVPEQRELLSPVHLTFERIPITSLDSISKDPNIALLDGGKLSYPLALRKWKEGDSFVPFGMNGHKKLSDFLVDTKLSLLDKQQQYVLLSGSDIVWVVGRRIDNRYRISSKTQQVLVIRLH